MFDGTRNPATKSLRVNWQEHRRKLIERGHFHRSYRTSPESFDTLVEMLGNILVINEGKAYARSLPGPIIPEIRLHCLMRYLAGGSYLDICTLVPIPHSTFYILHSTFYCIPWKTCYAINDCPKLAFRLPNTGTELEETSAGFEGISIQGMMRGCIGAIDGWLCPIQVSPTSLVGNVQTYFLGHYQRHGFNILQLPLGTKLSNLVNLECSEVDAKDRFVAVISDLPRTRLGSLETLLKTCSRTTSEIAAS
jgi:hypothetical protein